MFLEQAEGKIAFRKQEKNCSQFFNLSSAKEYKKSF